MSTWKAKPKILIVEDTTESAWLMSALLKDEYEISIA
jgi:CheY-like chemotaxis protein